MSSHQPADLTDLIQQFNPDLVIVKSYLSVEKIPQTPIAKDWTRWQVESARSHGRRVGLYVWCYGGVHWYSPEATIQETAELAQELGIPLTTDPQGRPDSVMWLDQETYKDNSGQTSWPSVDWGQEAEAELTRQELTGGMYTGRGFWLDHTGNTDRFSHWPLWNAWYGGDPDPDSFIPYGGWQSCWGKQWTSTPIDQNVFREVDALPELTPAIKEEYADLFNAWWEAGGWMNFGTYIAATGAADVPDYQFREFLRNRLDSVVNEVKVHLDR